MNRQRREATDFWKEATGQAVRELAPVGRYQVEHFLPADGARVAGGAAAIAAAQSRSSGRAR